MKQITITNRDVTITIPDGCELKQNGNTYTIVEKEKKFTYEDVARKLFSQEALYICSDGSIHSCSKLINDYSCDGTNCTSRKQAEKLLAINKLMNVAKYLNGDWQPDWDNNHEKKYYISVKNEQIVINFASLLQRNDVYFKFEELAKKAIEILGKDTIKLALCTDY